MGPSEASVADGNCRRLGESGTEPLHNSMITERPANVLNVAQAKLPKAANFELTRRKDFPAEASGSLGSRQLK